MMAVPEGMQGIDGSHGTHGTDGSRGGRYERDGRLLPGRIHAHSVNRDWGSGYPRNRGGVLRRLS